MTRIRLAQAQLKTAQRVERGVAEWGSTQNLYSGAWEKPEIEHSAPSRIPEIDPHHFALGPRPNFG